MIVLAFALLATGAVLCLALDFISLFNKDRAWAIPSWLYRLEGVESERTDSWNMLENIRGIAALVAGLGMAWFVWQLVSIALQRYSSR